MNFKFLNKQKSVRIYFQGFIISVLVLFSTLSVVAQVDEERNRGKIRQKKVKPLPAPVKPLESNPIPPTLAAGILSGKIIDEVSAEPLYGVSVIISETGQGMASDLDGNFIFRELKPGKYTLKFTYISYRTIELQNVEVKGGKENIIQIGMQEEVTQVETVQIVAEVEKASDLAALQSQKNSASILDGLSGEMIVKEASYYRMDNVLRRMPGVTLIEDRFISLRGLFERYNNVVFNGTLLPFTDLERTGFDFTSLPSGVITRLEVQKSAMADKYNDFSGGLINITTADMPTQNLFKVSVQLNYNDLASFKPFKSYPSDQSQGWQFMRSIDRQPPGFPTSRQLAAMPAGSEERYAAARKFVNPLVPNSFRAPMGHNITAALQRRGKLNSKTEYGLTGYVNYFDLYKFQYAAVNYLDNYRPELGRSPASDSSRHQYYSRQQNLTTLLNFAIATQKSVISIKTLMLFNSEDMVSDARGVAFDPDSAFDYVYTYPITRFTVSRLISGQLEGQHALTTVNKEGAEPLRVSWNLNYTRLFTDEPGYKATAFYYNPVLQRELFDPGPSPSETSLLYKSDLQNMGAQVRVQVPVMKHKANIAAGAFFNYTIREFRSQNMGLFFEVNRYDTSAFPTDLPMSTFYPENWRNVHRPENIGPGRFDLYDYSKGSSNYNAFRVQAAPYVTFNAKLKRIKINAGLRWEFFGHRIDTFPLTGVSERSQMLNYALNDLLPSLNVAYAFKDNLSFRFAFSQTVTRPADRELVPMVFFDIFSGTQSLGNPNLVRTKTTNADLRLEFFPSGKELVSATVFYKYFNLPLEQIFTRGDLLAEYSASQLYLVFNQNNAHAAGLEIETRLNLGRRLNRESLKDFNFIGNFTLLRSRINKNSPFGVFEAGRAMQGQAEYVLNLGIMYTEPRSKVSFGIFFNRAGERIAFVGLGETIFPDVIELPRSVLDVQISRTFGKRSTFQLALTDIFNQPIRLVQFAPGKSEWREGTDQYMRILQRGFNVFLTYTWKF